MSGFRVVVVGFDGSPAAHDALALGRRLAAPDGELVLACFEEQRAFRLPHPRTHPPAADVLEAGLAAAAGGIPARGVARAAASAARGLAEVAEQERADVLVLGAHAGAEGRTTPGSSAQRLLHGGPCAIAVAPLGVRETGRFHHVGVAYDGSPEGDAALAAAYALAARDGSAVSLLLAFDDGNLTYPGVTAGQLDDASQARRLRAQAQLDEAADRAPPGVNPRTVLLHGEAAPEVVRATEGIVDVLFCGSRGSGPLHRAFAGSVSEALLHWSTAPIVLLPRSSLAAHARAARPDAPAGTRA